MIYMSEIAKLSEGSGSLFGSIYVLLAQRYVITWDYTILAGVASRGSNSALERCVALSNI